MKWLKQSLKFILLWAIALPAIALQTVPIVNQGKVSAAISSKGYNTLRVNGDKIIQFLSTDGQYQLSTDPMHGFVYIKPATSTKAIHAALTTQHGRVFQVTFRVRRMSPQTIQFMPPDSFKPRAKSWEQQTTYQTLLVDLVKAMVNGQSLDGYRIRHVQSKPSPLGNIGQLTLLATYQGAHLVGQVYQLMNITKKSLQLTPEQLYRNKTRAISLSSQVVPPNGQVMVYEVVSRE